MRGLCVDDLDYALMVHELCEDAWIMYELFGSCDDSAGILHGYTWAMRGLYIYLFFKEYV